MTEEFISVSDLRKFDKKRMRETKNITVIVSKAQPVAVMIPYPIYMAVQELRNKLEAITKE